MWAILTALAVRLIVVAFAYPSFLDPQRENWLFGFEAGKVAESIAQGHGFGNPYYGGNTGPTAEVVPVFPYILAGVFAVFGIYTKASALAILSINSLFSALTCIPIFFIAKKSIGLREARWAAWTWAFFPYAIYFSADSMWNHALTGLLLACIFWGALYLQNSDRASAWAGWGLLIGSTALVNSVILGVIPFLALWACYRLHKQGKAWLLRLVTAGAMACIVIAPWLVRNYRTFRQPVFLQDGFPLAFCVGNVGNSVNWWNAAQDPSGNPAQMAEVHRIGEQAYMAKKWVEAREFLEKNPGTFVWRSIRRFVFMWTGYWSFNPKYLREEPTDPENIPFCTAVTILALIGLRKLFQKDASQATFYALLLAVYPLVYYITHPDTAYRHPIDPEIVILACCAIVSWRTSARKKKMDARREMAAAS